MRRNCTVFSITSGFIESKKKLTHFKGEPGQIILIMFEPEWGEMVSERGKFKIENIAL